MDGVPMLFKQNAELVMPLLNTHLDTRQFLAMGAHIYQNIS